MRKVENEEGEIRSKGEEFRIINSEVTIIGDTRDLSVLNNSIVKVKGDIKGDLFVRGSKKGGFSPQRTTLEKLPKEEVTKVNANNVMGKVVAERGSIVEVREIKGRVHSLENSKVMVERDVIKNTTAKHKGEVEVKGSIKSYVVAENGSRIKVKGNIEDYAKAENSSKIEVKGNIVGSTKTGRSSVIVN